MKKTVWRSLYVFALLPTLLTSCMAFDETDPLHEDSGPPPPMVDMASSTSASEAEKWPLLMGLKP